MKYFKYLLIAWEIIAYIALIVTKIDGAIIHWREFREWWNSDPEDE